MSTYKLMMKWVLSEQQGRIVQGKMTNSMNVLLGEAFVQGRKT
jgi:hypothetical protein